MITETSPATTTLILRCTAQPLHLHHLLQFILCIHSPCTRGSVSKVIHRRLRWLESPPTTILLLLLLLHLLPPLVSFSPLISLIYEFLMNRLGLWFASFRNCFRVCLNCLIKSSNLEVFLLWYVFFSSFWFRFVDCTAGLGIRVTIKPEYRITPPVSFDFEFHRFLNWIEIWSTFRLLNLVM